MTHCVHIHTTRSRLSDRSANPELSQTHEHSNFRGWILIWNSAALLGRYLCSPLYHTNALQHFIIELKWNIFWISNILYSTLNDYYLPSPLLKLFSSFFLGGEGFKNLFILFKQHLFCQNVLTDFFWMDFFFFLKAWTWLGDLSICFQVLSSSSSPFSIQGLNHTKGSSSVCLWWACDWKH